MIHPEYFLISTTTPGEPLITTTVRVKVSAPLYSSVYVDEQGLTDVLSDELGPQLLNTLLCVASDDRRRCRTYYLIEVKSDDPEGFGIEAQPYTLQTQLVPTSETIAVYNYHTEKEHDDFHKLVSSGYFTDPYSMCLSIDGWLNGLVLPSVRDISLSKLVASDLPTIASCERLSNLFLGLRIDHDVEASDTYVDVDIDVLRCNLSWVYKVVNTFNPDRIGRLELYSNRLEFKGTIEAYKKANDFVLRVGTLVVDPSLLDFLFTKIEDFHHPNIEVKTNSSLTYQARRTIDQYKDKISRVSLDHRVIRPKFTDPPIDRRIHTLYTDLTTHKIIRTSPSIGLLHLESDGEIKKIVAPISRGQLVIDFNPTSKAKTARK